MTEDKKKKELAVRRCKTHNSNIKQLQDEIGVCFRAAVVKPSKQVCFLGAYEMDYAKSLVVKYSRPERKQEARRRRERGKKILGAR